MKPDEIKLSDLQRILVGDVPAFFYIEVILRAAFIYILLMVSMRLMGKRMASQISRNEMAAVVSLAAAVGIPLMNPDRGVLAALIISVIIVVFQLFIAWRSSRNEKFEALTQGNLETLVADGVMVLDAMRRSRISRDRLFAQLRNLRQKNLGSVKRLYLEANGLFSLVEEKEPQPGLSIIPEFDVEFNHKMNVKVDRCVCYHCGFLETQSVKNERIPCTNCGEMKWVDAVA